jgi:hypothetical protein
MLRVATRLLYFVLVRLFWKKLPGLLKFQATEAESAWQLQRMIPRLDDPIIQRDVFEHYLEELYHAELFGNQARLQAISEGRTHLPKLPTAEREAILGEVDPDWTFFAFLSVGEASAVRQFSRITHALPDSPLKKTLRSILRDESKHVVDANRHAQHMAPAGKLKAEVNRLKRGRFKAEWMRQGLFVTDLLSSVLLWIVYWILAPLGARPAKRKIYGATPSVPGPILQSSLIKELKA